MNILFIYVMIYLSAMTAARVKYKNFTLYQVTPVRQDDVEFFQAAIKNNTLEWMFWTQYVMLDWPISIVTSPGQRKEFETVLRRHNIGFEITIDDLEREFHKQEAVEYDRRNSASFDWNNYNTLDSINAWLTEMQKKYDNQTTIIIGGETYEQRPIRGIRISSNLKAKNRIVVIEAGIHAREWISVSVATFIIKQLLDMETNDTKLARQKYDFYVFPVLNPDGYFYSHTTDRLWRKNRKPHASSVGVDLNRNFDIMWMVEGSSRFPTRPDYAGPHAFSEPETRSYSEFLQKIGERIHIYISLHSYSQLLLIPPVCTKLPDVNYSKAEKMGIAAAKALSKKYGTKYKVGSPGKLLYLVSGSSVDWVKMKLGTKLAFVYELRDTGQYGFALPKDQILPTCLETMDSIMSLVNNEHKYPRTGIFATVNHAGTIFSLVPCYILILLTFYIL